MDDSAAAFGVSKRTAYRYVADPAPALAPDPWVAACMSAEEWADWQRLNATGGTWKAVADRPCDDCPLGFAVEMRAEGRCNGTPAGVETDEHEETTVNDPEPAQDEGAIAESYDALPVSMEAPPRRAQRVQMILSTPPCGVCVHEPVCSLRLALEALPDVDVAEIALPSGLTVTLTAAVECAYFLRDRAKPVPVIALTSQERGQAAGAARYRAENGQAAKRVVSPETRERMRQAALATSARKKAEASA